MWLLLLLSVPDTQRIEQKADQVENRKRDNILMSIRKNGHYQMVLRLRIERKADQVENRKRDNTLMSIRKNGHYQMVLRFDTFAI
jgi:plasmid maintenance system killer protein